MDNTTYLTKENYEASKKGNISKVIIIKRLFTMLKCNSSNANLEKLKTLKFGERVGRISGKNITSATIINKSVTGLKVRKYEFISERFFVGNCDGSQSDGGGL